MLLFRIPREVVNMPSLHIIVKDENEDCKLDVHDPNHNAAQNDGIITNSLDYEAVLEATELQLESLNADIEARRKELEAMLTEAKKKSKSIIDDAKVSAETITSEAYEVGYNDGQAAAETELLNQRKQDMELVNTALNDINVAKQATIAKHENELVNLCFDIVEKIFGTDFERGQEELIRQALKTLGADSIEFAPEDTIFDYEGQTIDASFDTQLRKLRDGIVKIPRSD